MHWIASTFIRGMLSWRSISLLILCLVNEKVQEITPQSSIDCDLKMQEMDISEAHILSFFPEQHDPGPPQRITPAAIMGTAMPGLKLPFFS